MRNWIFLNLIIGLTVLWPISSFADWNGQNGGHYGGHDGGHDGHDGGRSGYHGGHDHSYIGVDLSLWPENYYYGTGYYGPGDAVLVSPPIYQAVVVNGVTYYLSGDGTYYLYNGYGYQPVAPPVTVVPQPEATIQPPEAVVTQAQASQSPVITPVEGNGTSPDVEATTINIPNKSGGYTAVTLKKSGNGYIGPQGEFYPEFPKVAQLEVIYGK